MNARRPIQGEPEGYVLLSNGRQLCVFRKSMPNGRTVVLRMFTEACNGHFEEYSVGCRYDQLPAQPAGDGWTEAGPYNTNADQQGVWFACWPDNQYAHAEAFAASLPPR